MNIKRQTWGLIAAVLCIGAGLAFGSEVSAQALTEDQYYGGEGASALTGTGFAAAAGLATGDLTTTIAALIRIVLGFLGIVAVLFVLYGGFTFMTSGGNDDKIKKSKKMLASAVIGLVIVLSAFTIVQFVLSRLIEATGGVTTDGPDDTPDYPDGDGTPSNQFVLTSLNTECAEAMKNLQLQFTFSQRVEAASVDAGGIAVETSGGAAVDGTFAVSGRRVTFTPSEVCAEDAEEFCFEGGADYAVTLDASILESALGSAVECSDAYRCSYDFTTGTAIDVDDPTMTMDAPDDDASAYVNDIELLQALAVDDTGVSSADFTVAGDTVYQAGLTTDSTEGRLATTNYFYTADGTEWGTAGLEPGNYSVRAEGLDCAGHSDTSDAVTVVLRAAHCNNGTTDEDETDLDCGGEDCGACDGDSCELDSDCASGYCDESTGECVGVPKIEEVSAGDGAVGNLVTISGEGFGSAADEITFLGDDTTAADDVVISAYECNGATQWSDDEIVVKLASGMVDGPVEVGTADGYSDRTDDDYGPTISDFDMNGVIRPGICLLDPDSDVGNSQVDVAGNNFGASQGTSTVYFGNYEASDYDSWADAALSVVVPLLNARSYDTQVWTGDYQCVNSDGSLVGGTCSEDADCDAADGQSCATMQCSESGDVCEEDGDCSDGEECVSLRQGSNEVDFTVTDASANEDPVIGSVDSGWEACSDIAAARCGEDADCSSDGSVTCDDAENWGPPGQYVTISGTGFGSSAGTVRFTDDVGYGLGDTAFPDACGEDFWDDTEITVKVPMEYQTGDAIVPGTFTLTVIAGGVTSDGAEFIILNDKPGPGICNMDPASGPAGTAVTFSGDNFGAQGSGYVEFYDARRVTSVDYWNATQSEAEVDVDADAQTGPVLVVSDEGYESNALDFEVSDCEGSDLNCSVTGTACCSNGSCSTSCEEEIPDSHYAWMFSTGDIPAYPEVLVQCDDDYISPSPWEGWNPAEEVCVSSVLTVSFSTAMDTTSYGGTVSVYPCVGTDPKDVCASLGAAVDGSVSGSSTGSTLLWQPNANWDASTAYQATVSTGVESTGGLNMLEDYVWEFTTAAATDKCTVDDVYVTPPTGTIDGEGETLAYGAAPVANRCVVLSCSTGPAAARTAAYDWEWESSFGGATLASTAGDGASYGCANVATAVIETPVGDPAEISATISSVIDEPSDDGELTIDYTDPQVTDYEPSCETACVNAAVNVYFNTAMENGASVFSAGPSGTVQVYECEDSLCSDDPSESTELSSLSVPIAYGVDYYTELDAEGTHLLSITPHGNFTQDTWYRVVIDGAVPSDSGVALSESGSNYPSSENQYYSGDFSWKFKTKDDSAVCAIDRVEVIPSATEATAVGERGQYVAMPYGAPDDCSATGQALEASGYVWDAWDSTDGVAGRGPGEDDVALMSSLALSYDLEDGCSSDCLNTGSAIGEGQAVCGDGTVDPDAEECEGGSYCSDSCLSEGNETACSSTVTTGCCGDGTVSASLGEECDDGNSSNDDGCSSACLNNGAARAETTCGDGTVDQSASSGGEDCDDGNATGGDGCSSDCLFEGGEDDTGVYSICGNGGDPEDGEDCDDSNAVDGDGCSSDCLYEGAAVCAYECYGGIDDGQNCAGIDALTCDDVADGDQDGDCLPVSTPCCGDGDVTYPNADRAEDCDDSNATDGDGCSSECLYEGSSEDYATPSYCGDSATGTTGTGEECEALTSSTTYAGNRGVSVILSTAPQDVVDGEATSLVTASSGTVDGTADLTLVCSCVEDSSCSTGGLTNACGTSSCCFPRPTESRRYPENAASDVCRNTAVWVDFTDVMDEASFDPTEDDDGSGTIDADEYQPNLYLELRMLGAAVVDSTNCPDSYTDIDLALADETSGPWIVRAWDWVVRSVRSLFGRPANATPYACLVPVAYSSDLISGGSRASVLLGDILEADATYRFVVVKDTDESGARDNDDGVLSLDDVSVAFTGSTNGETTTFTTGSEVCELEEVAVEDLGTVESLTNELADPSVEYFTEDGETHSIRSTPYTVRGGDLEEIAAIAGVYDWAWSWTSLCDDLEPEDATCTNIIDMDELSASTTSTATAEGNTGTELLFSTATFASTNTFGSLACDGGANAGASCDSDADCSGSACSAGSETGTLRVTANICDNPPTIGFPYEDVDSNFTFFYCRDAGNADDTTDDLPELETPINVTSYSSADLTFVQELIFKVSGTSDAIGVRVLANEGYLPPDLWYEDQGFTGSPSDTELDGYAAVQDGNTVYVAAANQASDGTIYPNVYVISYTEDADAASQEIFDQILANWSFNSNDDADADAYAVTDVNLCMAGDGSYPTVGGNMNACGWDGDCAQTCAIREGETALTCSLSGASCTTDASCATLTCDGEKEQLIRDTARLADVTRMAALLEDYGDDNGYCSVTTDQTCTSDGDCSGDETCEPGTPALSGGTFVASMSVSAWPSWAAELGNALGEALPEDPVNAFYGCAGTGYDGYEEETCWNATAATFICPDGSHVYGYRSAGGTGYEISTELEYAGGAWAYGLYDAAEALGTITAEYDYGGSATLATGFSSSESFCTGTAYGDSALCGDGLIGSGEVCEIGDVMGMDCASAGGTITVTCESDCQDYQTQTEAEDAGAECVPYDCGNGVVEEDNGEACDDGASNGEYGHCGDSCTLADAFSCGDGYLAGGEDCDCGETDNFTTLLATPGSWAELNTCGNSNGQYEQAPSPGCAWDCTSPGPMCGDAVVNGDEQCDGDYEAWDGGLCADLEACSTDADCDDGSACGAGGLACSTSSVCEDDGAGTATDVGEACTGGTTCDSGACSAFIYDLTRTRTCQTSGTSMCAWNAWTACESPDQYCGNGTVEGDETCDDGNGENTDACTNDCVENECGDDYVYSGVESCDDGDENGDACVAQYGGICYACTTNCQYVTSSGEYCGDGAVNGREFCDGSDVPYYYFFVDSSTAERSRGMTCDTYDAITMGDADDDGADDDTYTCRYLGVCNGGNYNGEPCSMDPNTGVQNTGGTIPSQAYAGCGSDGSCVAPVCADDCSGMCPYSYETAAVTVQVEGGDTDEETADLYSYLGGTGPDSATFFIPACSVATRLTADVGTDGIDAPSVAVMFVTDLSNSMGYSVDGADMAEVSPNRRIDYVVEAMEDGISTLFNSEFTDMQIGHLGFSGALDNTASTYDATNGSPGYYFDYSADSESGSYLLSSAYESDLMTAAELYLADPGNTGSNVRGTRYLLQWTPTYLGIEAAVDQLNATTADAKILVLLSDGNLSHDSAWTRCSTSAELSACVGEIRTGLVTASANSDISFYAAAITDDDTEAGYIAHMSSDACGTDYGDADDCAGNYFYQATTSDEIALMYEEIIDSILGITFNLSTDVDGATEITTGSVTEGRNQALPFPDNFECTGSEQGIPFRLEFSGQGYVSLSDISLTYCPAL